ncbi:hypothetical protein PV05_00687 [Exophiala xenobiotica]|uniref:Uncharacterized protein n=1 Tax=Exophiala xenobiotica TaxID=348802 RepID=A0A0D2EXP5_9EURO|nr:uncharacterized protein PV05_00687 [Exophiala xenobiotica]KIW60473.1 hypothetical protein PV05_00687 [Exophiala xenobiotica]
MTVFANMKASVVEKFRAAREWFKAKLTKETTTTPETRGVTISQPTNFRRQEIHFEIDHEGNAVMVEGPADEQRDPPPHAM